MAVSEKDATIIDPRTAQRELRAMRKHLKELTQAVSLALARIDTEMAVDRDMPSHGKRMGRIATQLDIANDEAMHFGLDKGFPEIKRIKASAERMAKAERK